jgi:hypothetical protein
MKKYILLFCLIISTFAVQSQELNCNISVSAKQVETTQRDIFATLQKSLMDFMNERRWTDRQYAMNERIDCNITIVIDEQLTSESFKGELQVQARRPVYGTSYNTTTLNFRDQNFNFIYREFEPLEFNENTFDSNLTAMMAYYAYLIIGMDSDSFAMFGGTPAFQKAENIVNLAQSSSESGWRAFESRANRYDIINNLMDERLRRFREFFYQYHRLGLDEMIKNPANARARIAESFKLLEEANRNRPSSAIIPMFLEAKNDEIVDIFSQGTDKEKADVHKILINLNPTQSTKYDEILRSR